MEPEDGKGLPGPLHAGGAFLALSLLISILAGGEVAEGVGLVSRLAGTGGEPGTQ